MQRTLLPSRDQCQHLSLTIPLNTLPHLLKPNPYQFSFLPVKLPTAKHLHHLFGFYYCPR